MGIISQSLRVLGAAVGLYSAVEFVLIYSKEYENVLEVSHPIWKVIEWLKEASILICFHRL